MDAITKEPAAKETFEVITPEPVAEVKAPAREDLKAKGWTADELERAEKRGMIAKPEDAEAKKKAEDAAKAKADGEAAAKGKEAADAGAEGKDKGNGKIPDFTFKTPEQEKAFLDAFGPGTEQRAMYFRMKNERQQRQQEKTAREAAEARAKAAEDRLAALEKGKPAEALDEDGNVIDPEERPLTIKEWKALQKAEQEAAQKKNDELNSQARRVAEAHVTQEEYMRAETPDFDDTVTKATQVMKNLDALVPERYKQAEIVALIKQLQVAAANADQVDLDDLHAARLAYKIGTFHPDYGKKAEAAPAEENGHESDTDGTSKDPKKANGSLTPEQMKRIEKNTQRTGSSAAISGGGGKRTISADDVDLKALNAMGYKDRQKFKEKYPDRYGKLVRG